MQGRSIAQERVTGGRWRRVALGDVLAEHVVELRGRARVCLAVEGGGEGETEPGRLETETHVHHWSTNYGHANH